MTELQTPTNDLLDKYIDQFNNDERYYPADQAIINLFKAFPNNKKLEDILLKLSVINDLYSTNILGTFKMAKHIQQQDIDQGLQSGDPDIVHRIAKGHDIRTKKNNREINFYSFATKYCNWHNRDKYAIYDSFVDKVLMAYKRKDKFSNFRQSDLKDFNKFKQIIEDFADHYNLTRHNLKEIDKFLWIYGKEKFPANYDKKE
ncbi:hypothetical protein [Echinicola shivajiensis]|uniref:hypothetical protein n=1 Tax=Echinicola shivajiensis TaxID=1035916 RepID=UPI001BFC3945|nr:hypothetical protein [Echinicola shivajiensis]